MSKNEHRKAKQMWFLHSLAHSEQYKIEPLILAIISVQIVF